MKWLLTFSGDEPPLPYYKEWVEAAGIEVAMITPKDSFPMNIQSYDALLLTGGGDIDPAMYHDTKQAKTDAIEIVRDKMELGLIASFGRNQKPIFGICRGMQMINVAFGGALIQHVPDIVNEIHAKQNDEDSYHPVNLKYGTKLGNALKGTQDVNSSHHQAVDSERVGKGLRVVAVSQEGIIEAVEKDGVFAVQWHPERLPKDHPASVQLIAFWKGLA